MKIRRVRCVGKTPICYQVSYVSHALVPNITRADLRRGSLYKYLERALNEAIYEADETIEAISADPYRADLRGGGKAPRFSSSIARSSCVRASGRVQPLLL